MENVTYKSGDVARMLGISQEAIRYYEKQGVVLFEKEEGNGYRFFQFRKLIAMVSLRLLNRLGFSVQESWHLVNGADTVELTRQMAEKEAQIAAQIARLQQIQAFSADQRQKIAAIPEHLNQISLRQCPGFYHIKFQNDREMIKDKQYQKIVKDWNENAPAVMAGILAPLDVFRPGYQAEIGFSIRNTCQEAWVHADHPAVQEIASGPALYMVAKVEPDCSEYYEPMRSMMEFLQTHPVTTQNRILAIPLAMRCRLDETQPMKDYYQVYVPLTGTPPSL